MARGAHLKGLLVVSCLLAGTAAAWGQPLDQLPGVPPPEPALQSLAPPAIIPAKGFALIKEYALKAASQPQGLIVEQGGSVLWFAATALGAIGRIDRTTEQITYFPLGAGARPFAIDQAGDASIFAVDRALNVIHRLDPTSGEVTRIAMPADTPHLDLAGLKFDADGKLWFVGATGWLGSHDPATGQTELSSHDDLQGLAFGRRAPDGSVWFLALRAGRMIHIDPHKSRFDSAALPAQLKGVRGVAIGFQGEVWLAFGASRALARYSGRATWHIAPLPWHDSAPQALLALRDGSILCADTGRRKLVRLRQDAVTFDEAGDLGAGGNIRTMVESGDEIILTDTGADRIRVFASER